MTPAERDHAQAINDFEATFGSPGDWLGCSRTWRAYEERYLSLHPAVVDVTDPESIGGDA